MKLSVCIPVYNIEVFDLVSALRTEIQQANLDAEIILIDDASKNNIQLINSKCEALVDQFFVLDQNIGRSKIRNLFLQYAKGECLIFLDCDGLVQNDSFLQDYLRFIGQNTDVKVLYGGRTVTSEKPQEKYILRWKYAHQRENPSLEKRIDKPYLSFQTNNFLIAKEVFQTNNFDVQFSKYGYEDLVFAMKLKEKGIFIHHFENPIFNNDLDENSFYLKKVEESIINLSSITSEKELLDQLSEIKILRAYSTLKILGTEQLVYFVLKPFRGFFLRNLLSRNPSLRMLDFYKLFLLIKASK